MTGRKQGHRETVDGQRLTIGEGLEMAGAIGAITQFHDFDGLGGGQHLAMSGARVVGMAMGDNCPRDRITGIDMGIDGVHAKMSIKPFHGVKIGPSARAKSGGDNMCFRLGLVAYS